MALFGFGSKKGSCCGSATSAGQAGGDSAVSAGGSAVESLASASFAKSEAVRIKVLGSGCAKCNALEKSVVDALGELGLDLPVGHVRDFAEIAAYGVMSTPALVIDEKVVSYGKVLSRDEAKAHLAKLKEPV